MLEILSDPRLYGFTGERPPTIDELRERYRQQVHGAPESTPEEWFNWILRRKADGEALGFVQATVVDKTADVAWLVATRWQRRGYATEAATEMRDWLRTNGATCIGADIHPRHVASQHVAAGIGLERTGIVDEAGEERWSSGRCLERR